MSKRGFDELAKESVGGGDRPESHTESWQGAKPTLEDRHINAVELPGGGWLWGLYVLGLGLYSSILPVYQTIH